MGVSTEALKEAAHLLVDHRVASHAIVEIGLLRLGRQFAVKQQVTGFQEVPVLGQLLDRIAAIKQDTLVAVDIGDLGLAACRGSKPGIVGEHPALTVKLRDIDDLGTDRAGMDRQVPIVVIDGQRAGFILGAGFGVHGRAPELAASNAH